MKRERRDVLRGERCHEKYSEGKMALNTMRNALTKEGRKI